MYENKNVGHGDCRLSVGVFISHRVKFTCVHLTSHMPLKHHCIICSTAVPQITIILNVSVGIFAN